MSYLNNNSFYLLWNLDECKLAKPGLNILHSPCKSPTLAGLYKICSSPQTGYGLIIGSPGKQEKETSISNYPFQMRYLVLVFCRSVLLAVGHELQCEYGHWSKYVWQVGRDWINIFSVMSVKLFGSSIPSLHHIPALIYICSLCEISAAHLELVSVFLQHDPKSE